MVAVSSTSASRGGAGTVGAWISALPLCGRWALMDLLERSSLLDELSGVLTANAAAGHVS